jgi:hybrid cluster-associated redox disulfide protein
MGNEQKINENMTFGEVIEKYPQVIPIFFKFGLHCIGCMVSTVESIADGAAAHGIDSAVLIKALNEELEKPS